MRLSLMLPTHRVDLGDELAGGPAVMAIARAVEQAGFDAVFVTDHPFPGDSWLGHGGHHTLDPFVALSFAAAATTRLRLHTNLYVLAYRNPFLSAKQVATLDAMSGGRVILGVGAGYLQPEFAALGVDFAERNELTDEAIVAVKAALTGESVRHDGRHFTAAGNTMLPRPAQRPHPPIWIGGNSRRAIRRAVELADGWSPMHNPARMARHVRTPALETVDDLRGLIGYAAEHAAAVGRTAPLDVAFMPFTMDMSSGALPDPAALAGGIAALAEVGVTWATLALPAESRRDLLAAIERYGSHVVPATATLRS